MPIKRINVYRVPDIEQEDLTIAEWAFDSHYWVEENSGYFKCKWCGRQHTNTMVIMAGYPLCSENPSVKNYLLQKTRGGG